MSNEITLQVPFHIKPYRNTKDTVCIDVGIKDVLLKLWSRHVITLGCCEGHQDMKYPYNQKSIIVHERYTSEEIEEIKLIAGKDVTIQQWTPRLEIKGE